MSAIRELMNAVQTHFGDARLYYEGMDVDGGGRNLLYNLQRARAYTKHQLANVVNPYTDGIFPGSL